MGTTSPFWWRIFKVLSCLSSHSYAYNFAVLDSTCPTRKRWYVLDMSVTFACGNAQCLFSSRVQFVYWNQDVRTTNLVFMVIRENFYIWFKCCDSYLYYSTFSDIPSFLMPFICIFSDSSLRNALDFKKMGQRIYVFIIGGATRSEVQIFKLFSFSSKLSICFTISSLYKTKTYFFSKFCNLFCSLGFVTNLHQNWGGKLFLVQLVLMTHQCTWRYAFIAESL